MKRNFFIFLVLIAAGLAIFLVFSKKDKPIIVIGGQEIKVAIADTPALRQQGLSQTVSLPEDGGMLFVFEAPGEYGFWMKDMNYAIDILWLNEAGRIIHIEKNVAPETFPTVFTPEEPARYALEVNAGFSDEFGLKIGDLTVLPKRYIK